MTTKRQRATAAHNLAPLGRTFSAIDPLDIGRDELRRTSVDILISDHLFMEGFASYRNALAVVTGQSIVQWSKKQLAELFISMQCEAARLAMADMFEALGPMPEANDTKGMIAYAKRAVAWGRRAKPSDPKEP